MRVFTSNGTNPNDRNKNRKPKMKTTKTIKAGQTLTTRSICDYNCIYTLEVLSRKGAFAVIKWMNDEKRKKVLIDSDGCEFIMPERYSMAPVFKAI